jgi:predicted XRE-type DNA-binding protein
MGNQDNQFTVAYRIIEIYGQFTINQITKTEAADAMGFEIEQYANLKVEQFIENKEPKQETIEEAAEIYSSHFLNQEENKFSKEDFINGAKWMQERMYSEEEVINLLETQRGNSYVAVLSATKNDELASIALNAPKPGGMKQFKKK